MMRTMAPTQVMGAFIIIRMLPLMKFWIWVTSLVILVMMEAVESRSMFSKERLCTFRYRSPRISLLICWEVRVA